MHIKQISSYPELHFERNHDGYDLQQEFNFLRADLFTRKLLSQGLISRDEFQLIMQENRRTFPTFLSSIL
ncbi:SHOCT domain-containing protein [Ruminobacter sp.]|uniref:SHOCT domain-containing protein n=1 Tax=Ruminobacter sp. TaxID=2774296 RepID=UPI00386A66F0